MQYKTIQRVECFISPAPTTRKLCVVRYGENPRLATRLYSGLLRLIARNKTKRAGTNRYGNRLIFQGIADGVIFGKPNTKRLTAMIVAVAGEISLNNPVQPSWR